MSTLRVHSTHDPSMIGQGMRALGFVLLCQAAGVLGTPFVSQAFYRELEKPSWAPPAQVFGPVWIVLYTLVGIAGFLVWRTPITEQRRLALTLFVAQLVVNALWTPVFFGARQLEAAFGIIVVLVGLIVGCIVQFRRVSQAASWLFVPYLAWVSFATALNAAIAHANR
jgi:benzodiazapine receptor